MLVLGPDGKSVRAFSRQMGSGHARLLRPRLEQIPAIHGRFWNPLRSVNGALTGAPFLAK